MASMPKTTWYRHKKIFTDAELSWGDLATGQIVQFRRRALVLEQPVQSWDDLLSYRAA